MLEIINSEKFAKEIFDFHNNEEWKFIGDKPVIINLFATWCGPCHMFAPVLEKISQDYEGKVKVYKIDIDHSPEVPAIFGVRSVPTTIFIHPAQEPAIAQGFISEEGMVKAIQEILEVSTEVSN